jgi:hypothetical protein
LICVSYNPSAFQETWRAYLAKLSNVSNPLALERLEVGRDAAGLEVHDTSEGLVEERTNRGDWEATSFGLTLELAMKFVLANWTILTAKV